MTEEKKALKYIGLIGVFAIVFSLIAVSNAQNITTYFTSGDIWKIRNDGEIQTVYTNDSSYNINIGQNASTTYKLNVNGTSITKNLTVVEDINLSVDDFIVSSIIRFGDDKSRIYMGGIAISPTYLNIESFDSIKLTGDDIIFDGNIGLFDNIYFGFGSGSLGYRDFSIGYNSSDASLRFFGGNFMGAVNNKFHFNNNNRNTDFEIDGDTIDKVFCLDASLDKINMTEVNITNLLTIPCVTTSTSLIPYQVLGSIILNVTTNEIGSYNNISWKWR